MTHPDTASGSSSIPAIPLRRHRPLVPIVMAFCVAILAAERSADHLLWGFAMMIMLAGVGVGLALRYPSARRPLLSAACTLVLGYAYTLCTAVYLPANHVSRFLESAPITLEGRVLRVAKTGADKTTLDLSARALMDGTTVISVAGRVRVTAYDFEPLTQEGDIVRLHRIRLRRPMGFRNPGGFDYGRYLARRGIYAMGSISRDERFEVVQPSSSVLLKRFFHLKTHVAGWIDSAMNAEEAAITKEMVLGLRGVLPPQVREAFNASGTVHLLSVSGFHVAAVYGAIFLLLRLLFKQLRFRLLYRLSGGPRPSKLAAVSALGVVIAYACLITLDGLIDLVDPNFPAIRSTLMITTFVLAYLIDRDGDAFNITLLAAFVILTLSPFALFGIGFQLSFVGILMILYAYRFLYPAGGGDANQGFPLNYAARLQRWLRDVAVVSTFASIGTTPLILYHFERLPLIAPLANIIVAPFASIAVPSALVACFTMQILQPLGSILLVLTGVIVKSMYAAIRFFAGLPYAAPHIGAVSLPVVVLAYATILLLPYSYRHHFARWGTIGGTVLVSLWLTWPWLLPAGGGQLQITFLDVGQGDASFVRFPDGGTMLIDGGGSYRDDVDLGALVVAPFLWHTRVRHLDYLVATHPQSDHAKGLLFPLRHFPVQQFWDNGARMYAKWYGDIRQEADNRGLYRDVMADNLTATTVDGVHLELLHPTASFRPQAKRRGGREAAGENNRSLVLKLTYGSINVLFTGDIEQEAESFMLQSGQDLRATILKVPHHGSQTSSSEPFVRAVNPRVAVISVQRDSRFGHPHPVVLGRYQALGTQIFRTDDHGAITIRTDGQSVWVEPYIGGSVVLSAPVIHHLAETHMPLPSDGRR
jgi:competence protein ComEC